MLLKRPRGAGGAGVSERTPVLDKREEPRGLEESTLGTIKSSLTVIENPSLDGYLGILMAEKTLLRDEFNAKSFFHAYVLWAYEGVIDPNVSTADIAKSENVSKDGDPPLYVVSYQGGRRYEVASQVPHEVCKITDDEFRMFEGTLTSPHQHNTGLTGMVNNMMQLIGERLIEKGFAFEDGKLVLPPNYASTRI